MSLVILKDPDAIVDYSFDWNDGYLDTTTSPPETISTSTWSIDPAPSSPALSTELSESSSSKTTTTATIFLTGGTAGKVYRVTNKVVTSGGRTDERTMTIRVEER